MAQGKGSGGMGNRTGAKQGAEIGPGRVAWGRRAGGGGRHRQAQAQAQAQGRSHGRRVWAGQPFVAGQEQPTANARCKMSFARPRGAAALRQRALSVSAERGGMQSRPKSQCRSQTGRRQCIECRWLAGCCIHRALGVEGVDE